MLLGQGRTFWKLPGPCRPGPALTPADRPRPCPAPSSRTTPRPRPSSQTTPPAPPQLTDHGILRVRLLVVHLADLLVCGRVDLTQHAEPLAVGRRTRRQGGAAPGPPHTDGTSSQQLCSSICPPLRACCHPGAKVEDTDQAP